MNDFLKILDEMDELRRKAEKQPQYYPQDFLIRACEAIVAAYAGYNDRCEWQEELKKYDTSYRAVYGEE